MRRLVWLFAYLMQTFCAFSQSVLTGVVLDAQDHKPVPYVSIGVTSTPNGSVSGAAGVFSITLLKNVTDNDTLKFSSIGYSTEAFLIRELKEEIRDGPLRISLRKT